MKRKREREHHRLDNMTFWVSGGGRTAGVKQHRVTMIVIPEEFLPPLGRKEVICFFLNHRIIIIAMINVLNSIFGYNTMFSKMSNKIQTGVIKFPQICNAQIYNVLKKFSYILKPL